MAPDAVDQPPRPSPAPDGGPQERLRRPRQRSSSRLGRVVAGSTAGGLVAGIVLVAAPVTPATEAGVTGAFLGGLALGWATLAALSTRLSDQPQRWAAVPALVLGLSGLLLVVFGSPVHGVLVQVWPPAVLLLVMWMFVRARRDLRSTGGRLVLYPVLLVSALACVAGGLETVRAAADADARRMPGRLIDVGGHRLHLSCTGAGSPTVVLEPGAGGVSSELGLIVPAVARDTRVCVYDRAGRGWSEPAAGPQDATRIATDLHTLLHRGQVPGPYVLAGHSFGGLYALTFAARYPEEVAGMVLVDSTAPAPGPQGNETPPGDGRPDDLTDRISVLVSTSARLGVGRLVDVPTASHLHSAIHEFVQGGASMEQAASLRDLTGKPLVVLTAGVGSASGWSAEQEALATLSTNSAHRVVAGVSHGGMIDDHEGAAATTRGILDVVGSVRTAAPLTD